MNITKYKNLISRKPIHIATVNKSNNPNLSVASDVIVLDDNKILISANEMTNTQNNIEYNENVVLTAFNEEWVGIRLFGKAKYFTEGKYYDMCMNNFFSNGEVTVFGATKPKRAIVVTIDQIEEYK